MSLQRRLTIFFVLIVILPLAVAGFVVQRVVVGEIARRAELSLEPLLESSLALYNERVDAIDERVAAEVDRPSFAKALESGRSGRMEQLLQKLLAADEGLDFLLVQRPSGRIIGTAERPGNFVDGFERPSAKDIAASASGTGPGFVRAAPIPVRIQGEGSLGSVSGGFWVDEDLLGVAGDNDQVDLAVVVGRRVIASTTDLPLDTKTRVVIGDVFETDLGGEASARAIGITQEMALVAFTPRGPITSLTRQVLTSLLGLLALALLLTSVLAYLLARPISQPLEELAERAKAMAEGRFEQDIPVRSGDEVGALAEAFNDMTHRLRDTFTQLESSRDQLQRTVRRVGETLRSTHDMKRVLQSITHTARDAVDTDGCVLWMFTGTRDTLYPALIEILDPKAISRIEIGEGVVGRVAELGRLVVLGDGDKDAPRVSKSEPQYPVVVAAPIYSQDRVLAVLAAYRRDADRPFSQADVDTIVFLAEQGGVGIENVLLHEEAQRLSLTDQLTGAWNRRFFQMQFRQVHATATRFERPFSVLMLDLDHFKNINDTYGHQRGDAILVEFASRAGNMLREVDTFARYGGEEFICLLSETDLYGAMTTADKILQAVRSEPFGGTGEAKVDLTVSIGVASFPEHGDTFRQLVEAADRALYEAKKGGRDRAIPARKAPNLKLAESS
ncbi:MAG TPA: diguanylate cyclase [Actinomycetota bacterium]|nr:diguanylate cyclase [Actinomycetota bacterium]